MIPSIALQKAVFTELSKGVYPVHEVVPSDTKELPLITIQDFNRETNFTKTNHNRFTFSTTVHGWSVGRSSIQSKEIEEFIYQTIMNLDMEEYDVEFVNLSMNTNLKEDEKKDSIVFHSVQQFEITISKRRVINNGN